VALAACVSSIRAGVPVAVAAGLAAVVVSVVIGVAVTERANPRHAQDAAGQLSLSDPLADVYAQQKAPVADVYSVQSASLDKLHLWRTAAVDVYNREAWAINGRINPLGQ